MHADMIALRKRHVEKITEVSQFFQSVEDSTKKKFLSFLEVFRTAAQGEIAAHKLSLHSANLQLSEQREHLEQRDLRINALEELVRVHERGASDAAELSQGNMAAAESRHSEVRRCPF